MNRIFLMAASLLATSPGLLSHACACPTPEGEGGAALLRPVPGKLITGYGLRLHPLMAEMRWHDGVDLAAGMGEPVLAARAGRVTFAARQGEGGNAVTIAHDGGLETTYWHLQRIEVRVGDCVVGGFRIGRAGSTGLAMAPHLHFAIREAGVSVDPARRLDLGPEQRPPPDDDRR